MPRSSLSRAKARNCTTDCNSPDNLSLSFSAVSQIRLTWSTDVYSTTHTHTSRLLRLSSPGLRSLLNHLAEHCVVYWANWIPQYQNQKMLSSINRLRQLIARDKAKQPQLKNPLTKSHDSSQSTIGRDSMHKDPEIPFNLKHAYQKLAVWAWSWGRCSVFLWPAASWKGGGQPGWGSAQTVKWAKMVSIWRATVF